MTVRQLLTTLRWSFLVSAALLVSGVIPLGTAEGLTGDAGPIAISVSPAVNLSDGQVVLVHAQSKDPNTVIYALKAHLCHPGMVKGDTSFSLDNAQCASVPIGQSDVERHVVIPGASSGDLQFKVGVGNATWITGIGLDGSMTCDPSNPCDLVIQAEITNSTVYFRAPLCFGAGCAPDTDPNAAPTPAAGSGDGGNAGAAATPSAAAQSDDGGGGKDTTAGKAAVGGAASAVGSARGGGTSHSSASGDGSELADAKAATAISNPIDGPSRGIRVLIALIAGAVGGARIVTVVNRSRSRGRSLRTA